MEAKITSTGDARSAKMATMAAILKVDILICFPNRLSNHADIVCGRIKFVQMVTSRFSKWRPP